MTSIPEDRVDAAGWRHAPVGEVAVGDVIRLRGDVVITVSRIESPFLGRAEMLAFIEDTPERWLKCPAPVAGTVEIQVG